MDMAAATGHLKRGAHAGHLRDLRHATAGPRHPRAAGDITRSRTPPDPAAISAAGIGVVKSDEKAGAGWPVVTESRSDQLQEKLQGAVAELEADNARANDG